MRFKQEILTLKHLICLDCCSQVETKRTADYPPSRYHGKNNQNGSLSSPQRCTSILFGYMSIARGMIMASDRSLLVENGGSIELNKNWARQVLYRMETNGEKLVRRMATTSKIPVSPGLLTETKLDYQRRYKSLLEWHSIPKDLVINFDQTPLPYVCASKHTLEKQGTKSVPLVGKGKCKQITGTFAISQVVNFYQCN